MKRGDIFWADLGRPAGRRPVLVVTRSVAIPVLSSVVVAPCTRTIRDIASEIPLGLEEGLPDECVAVCDSLLAVPRDRFDPEPIGSLDASRVPELDAALRFALGIAY